MSERWRYYSTLQNWFDNFGSGHEFDLDQRAAILCHGLYQRDSVETLVMMDGHGRLVTRIASTIAEILERGRKLDIKVYDLNPDVDNWHKNTMPLNEDRTYTCDKENILTVHKLHGFNDYKVFAYFNFCGFEMMENSQIFYAYIRDLHLENCYIVKNMMISFSTIRSASHISIPLEFLIAKLPTKISRPYDPLAYIPLVLATDRSSREPTKYVDPTGGNDISDLVDVERRRVTIPDADVLRIGHQGDFLTFAPMDLYRLTVPEPQT